MDPRRLWMISGLLPPRQLLCEGVDLSPGEASALAARGLLHPLMPGLWSPRCPDPPLRAWAAGLHLRPGTREQAVICGLSAAWVHGAAAAPRTLEIAAARGARRLHPLELLHVQRRYLGHTRYEDQRIGPVRVSTPLRTAVDLARGPQTPAARSALATLMLHPRLRVSPEAIALALRAQPRLSARGRALAALREVAGALPPHDADGSDAAGPEAAPEFTGRGSPVRDHWSGAGREPVIR